MKQNGNRNIMFEAALNPIDTDPVDLLFFVLSDTVVLCFSIS